jgi:saccharopine dehydrogenase-like NADP-dependent oxidoreductase
MGRIMVRDLQRTSRGRVRIVVADRDVSAAPDLGVETTQVDVSDSGSLRRALDGAYATIASLPYRYNLEAMHGALEAGTHYVDLGGLFHMTRRQLELAPEFERRGLMAILGMGSAPGIVNVLATLAARSLDAVREIHCLVGGIDRTRYRNLSPLWFGYSADTLLDEFTMPSPVFRAGRFTTVPPLDPGERVAVHFPAPIGTIPVDTTIHSEVATLPLSFGDRGIREVTFRQGFDTEFRERLSFLVQLGLAETTALASLLSQGSNCSGIVPRDVLLALVRRFPPPVPIGKPHRYEVLRTVVRGTHRGRRVTVTADCHAGRNAGWGIGPDIDTGAPPSIAVQLMLSGELELRPGVWAPEQVVPAGSFVRELNRRALRVTCRRRAVRRE